MKRGELWTVAAGGFARKPRPAVIIQDDRFRETSSVTVCLITSDETEAESLRVRIDPTETNGLTRPSHAMADKLMTISRHRLGKRVGNLEVEPMAELNRAIVVFLGIQ